MEDAGDEIFPRRRLPRLLLRRRRRGARRRGGRRRRHAGRDHGRPRDERGEGGQGAVLRPPHVRGAGRALPPAIRGAEPRPPAQPRRPALGRHGARVLPDTVAVLPDDCCHGLARATPAHSPAARRRLDLGGSNRRRRAFRGQHGRLLALLELLQELGDLGLGGLELLLLRPELPMKRLDRGIQRSHLAQLVFAQAEHLWFVVQEGLERASQWRDRHTHQALQFAICQRRRPPALQEPTLDRRPLVDVPVASHDRVLHEVPSDRTFKFVGNRHDAGTDTGSTTFGELDLKVLGNTERQSDHLVAKQTTSEAHWRGRLFLRGRSGRRS
mmetsp:Transcript_23097/g.57431  ORF Transcript_23097/g.57431 Transcript_23097/m.57431 type:complete len:327 (-) Transcript_23097:282-1262(-)